MFATPLGLAALSRSYTPAAALGSLLLGYWDAERTDLLTQSAGAVSSWRDAVGGYDATQATGAAQPVWSPTSFGGRAGVTFDGSDDTLATSSAAQFPTGAAPSELWALAINTASDSTTRTIVGYGNTGQTARTVGRSTTNLDRGTAGDGSASQAKSGSVTLTSGMRFVMRWQVGATASTLTTNGTAGGSVSVVPATDTARLRISGIPTSAGSNFWAGTIAAMLVTLPLNETQAARLYAWLYARTR
jgi:hypothetical protein